MTLSFQIEEVPPEILYRTLTELPKEQADIIIDLYYDRFTTDQKLELQKMCTDAMQRAMPLEHMEPPEKESNPLFHNKAEYLKWYREKNKGRIRARRKEYLAENPDQALAVTLRKRIADAIKGRSKSAPSMELVGCSVNQVRRHLEKQFEPGMSWDNHGVHGWHIDHVTPCASFDLTDPEQQRQCFNYRNLRPMWAKDNISKGAKLPHEWKGRKQWLSD